MSIKDITQNKWFHKRRYLAALLPLLAAMLACNLPFLNPPGSTAQPTATLAPADTAVPLAPSPTAGSSASTGGGALSGDPQQAVVNALKKVMNAGPYHVHSVTTTADGNTTEMDGDVILPDRYHMTTSSGEYIVIGSKTYMNLNGTWSLFPVDLGSIVSGLTSSFTSDVLNNVTNASYVGPDVAGGKPAQVYQFTESIQISDQAVTSNVKMWVGVANGLPVKMQVEGEFAGVKSTTVQDITYDSSIKIEAPISP
jgi:hypothetical protein